MTKEAFADAVEFFVDVVGKVPDGAWGDIALGVWTARDLVGHTSRAMLTTEQYATVGADRAGFGSSDDIAERGREAGRQLGNDPVGAVREIAGRVTSLVAGLADDHVLRTPAGERSLADYLPSRVTELTIHTMDLAKALGVEVEPPAGCLRETLYTLSDHAVRQGVAGEVAFALTGRSMLREGFSVVQ